jgi:hypothetical protein
MKMKRFSAGMVAIITTLCFAAPSFAADSTSLVALFVIGQASYTVNGESRTMDVAPYIRDERTFLPVRFAAHAVGVADSGIAWDGRTGTVTIVKGGDTIVLVIGNATMNINGEETVMDVAPEIVSDRTMLPLRFVGEALGAKVDWDQGTRTAMLTLGDAVATPVVPPVVIPTPVSGEIDMTAAMDGTLQSPAGAVAAPGDYGFAPQAREIAFTVGNQTATLIGLDGSTRQFDLGVAPMMIASSQNISTDDLTENNPNIYKMDVTLKIDPNGPSNGVALYAPFIPIAEAFGVPAANIRWDGAHLALYGMYQHTGNYRVLTVGSRDVICKVDGSNPEVVVKQSEFPLLVLDGQPAMGITSVSDFWPMLFIGGGGDPNVINAAYNGRSWDYSTGTAAVGCNP